MKKPYKKYDQCDLKKLQSDILVVLKSFDALCKKYNIEYYAIGGTQLGAVRHKGYIPWDDDMDLGMLYSDYKKFLSIPEEEFKEYGLYSPEKTPGDYYSFVTKYYYKESKFISPIAKADGKDDMGIFVEIFPYYNIPADNKIINNTRIKISIIKALYTISSCDNVIVFEKGIKGMALMIIKRVLKCLLNVFKISPKILADKYDKILCKYQYEDTSLVVMCSDGFNLYKKEWLNHFNRVTFEDTSIPIPNGYKKYLCKAYGDDYMEIPPESDRWNQAAEYIRFIDGTEMKN